MSEKTALETIQHYGVVPVVVVESVASALPLADALFEGGLPIIEVTFRTAAAAKAIEIIVSERPEMLVGAGTVITEENLEQAKASGAKFAVAPGSNPAIVSRAAEIDLPFIPGVSNPSDIECGISLGAKVLKFFPADALGGMKVLNAMAGPYKHTGIKFMPSGGISQANMEAYLSAPSVVAVGGTWLATPADISEGNWAEIVARCQAAVAVSRPKS